ncbi:putative F-box/LRR-repeat protein 23 isoform X2 [Alnus glutinosa]|nr:putative F-box/LRR-repeat protein 23 isoform X2 [Alnus glutinosa]XP_062162818.1 putative F-box/LRR-repeat protein 23 isoform X2 [Alnus glutinosa]XP_062162819.1 putative F-box/LRR-repeat protein 23 isoform X2 [Alnus glutinosa]
MDPSPDPADEFRNWLALPRDVTASILMRLEAFEILTSAQMVCSSWHNLYKDPSMWRAVHMRKPVPLWEFPYDVEKMCRNAVDRSCGQLVHINVENFGTDELLRHIADSSSQLKCLRLVRCYHISDKGLSEVAAKLPLLEELVISYCFLSKEALEAVGRCCSHLKSLKFNSRELWHFKYDEEELAIAIAENMSELRHLQLFGNRLTNDGLQAILDGCPHLESLDLRECFNVSLAGNLGRGCSEQIKDLWRPHDSTDDYDFKYDLRIYIRYFEDLDDFDVYDDPTY